MEIGDDGQKKETVVDEPSCGAPFMTIVECRVSALCIFQTPTHFDCGTAHRHQPRTAENIREYSGLNKFYSNEILSSKKQDKY